LVRVVYQWPVRVRVRTRRLGFCVPRMAIEALGIEQSGGTFLIMKEEKVGS